MEKDSGLIQQKDHGPARLLGFEEPGQKRKEPDKASGSCAYSDRDPMVRVVHIHPDIRSGLKAGRVARSSRAHIETQLKMLILRPIFQKAPGEIIAGSLEPGYQVLCVYGSVQLIDVNPRQL